MSGRKFVLSLKLMVQGPEPLSYRFFGIALLTGATMAVGFSLPKQWEDWCSWLFGLWLCISPWALRFDLDSTATQIAVISGILVILAELLTLTVFRPWEEWINVILGAWLIVCPWIVGISSSTAKANFVVIGASIAVLALYEIWTARRQSE